MVSPGEKAVGIGADSVQQEIVDIDLAHQRRAPVVPDHSQGSASRGTARRKQGVHGGREGTNIVGARPLYVSHHVNAHRAQARQRDFHAHILELLGERSLNHLLRSRDGLAGDRDGTCFGKGHLSLPVYGTVQALGKAAPEVKHQTVARPKNIIRAGWKIHWNIVSIPGSVAKDAAAEALEFDLRGGELRIQIVERGDLAIRAGAVHHSRRSRVLFVAGLRLLLSPGVRR